MIRWKRSPRSFSATRDSSSEETRRPVKGFRFDLCPACHVKFVKDPLGQGIHPLVRLQQELSRGPSPAPARRRARDQRSRARSAADASAVAIPRRESRSGRPAVGRWTIGPGAAQRTASRMTLVTTERASRHRQGGDDLVAAVDVAGHLDHLLLAGAAPSTRSASPSARPARAVGLLAGDHRALALEQALQVEDQVVGVAVAVLAVLGHHRLDDHAQAAGEPGVEVVGRDEHATFLSTCFRITSVGVSPP